MAFIVHWRDKGAIKAKESLLPLLFYVPSPSGTQFPPVASRDLRLQIQYYDEIVTGALTNGIHTANGKPQQCLNYRALFGKHRRRRRHCRR